MSSSELAAAFERVTALHTLHIAWDHVQRGDPTPGVDRQSLDDSAHRAPERLVKLRDALVTGRWRPRPARRIALAGDPERRLVEDLLEAGIRHGAHDFDPGVGTLQGSALSPLLSNIYLHPVDEAMEAAGYPYLRYADDILLLTETESGLTDGLALLEEQVRERGLALNARKTRRRHVAQGTTFLGARFDGHGRTLDAGACRALGDRGAAISDLPGLSGLIHEWSRWYGPPRPGDIWTLAVVLGAALHAQRADDDARLRALAAVRPAIDDDATYPTTWHVHLCALWSSLDGEAARRAAVLDAAALDDPALSDTARARLADILGVPAKALADLDGDRERLGRALAGAGRLNLAEVARAFDERPAADRPPELATADDSLLDAFIARFAGAEGGHALERADANDHLRLHDVEGKLTRTAVRDHLRGGPRRAIHLVRSDGGVACACVLLFIRRRAVLPPWSAGAGLAPQARQRWAALRTLLHDHALAFRRAADRLGWPTHLEDTGRDGRRVWLLFARPIHLRRARAALARLLAEVGDPPEELSRLYIPHNDKVRRRPGPRLILPLGLEPRTGRRSEWLTPGGDPIAEPLPAITDPDRLVAPEAIERVVRRGPAAVTPTFPHAASPMDRLDGLPHARQVLARCAVLRALAEKVARLGRLDGRERATFGSGLNRRARPAPHPDDEGIRTGDPRPARGAPENPGQFTEWLAFRGQHAVQPNR